VSAPVFGPEDRLVAALVIAGPSHRLPVESFSEFGYAVASAAQRLSAYPKMGTGSQQTTNYSTESH